MFISPNFNALSFFPYLGLIAIMGLLALGLRIILVRGLLNEVSDNHGRFSHFVGPKVLL